MTDRTGRIVLHRAHAVQRLSRPGRQRAFLDIGRTGLDVEHEPVNVRRDGRRRIVDHQSEALGIGRRAGPLERRTDPVAVAGIGLAGGCSAPNASLPTNIDRGATGAPWPACPQPATVRAAATASTTAAYRRAVGLCGCRRSAGLCGCRRSAGLCGCRRSAGLCGCRRGPPRPRGIPSWPDATLASFLPTVDIRTC